MLKFNSFTLASIMIAATLSMPMAFAESGESEALSITPSSGALKYSVYESVAEDKEATTTTYIEISDSETTEQALTMDMALMLQDEKGVKALDGNPTALLSGRDLIEYGAHAGAMKLMKTGTVKFFNESKKGKKIYVGNLPFSSTDERILILPEELQMTVNEAKPMSPRENRKVIIILRLQSGKKGLNAVNVKLA
jgi:cold shock CspA family protein